MIFKKQLLEYALPFPEGVYYDWWLAAVASANGGVQWVNKTLVARRMHAANASENVPQPVSIKNFTVNRLRKFYAIPNISEAAKHIIITAIQLLENGSNKELMKFFYKNRTTFFYYKKSTFPFISYYKAAKKLAAGFNQ
jgi:hypothetical protein